MFKKRKEKARRSPASGNKNKSNGRIISSPHAMLEVEQISLSSDMRKKLQVPAGAFACMAVRRDGKTSSAVINRY